MSPVNDDLIDRLGAAAMECRELIREAHAATKDLRQAIKDAEQAVSNLAGPLIEAKCEAVLVEGIELYQEVLRKAIDKATEAVFHRFDTLADTLTGKGKPDGLEEIARTRLAARAAVPRGRDVLP